MRPLAVYSLGLVGTLAFALGPEARAATSGAEQKLRAALADDLRRNPEIPGEALAVTAPGLDIAVAVGKADVQAGTPLAADTPFRVAQRDQDLRRRGDAATGRAARRSELDAPISTVPVAGVARRSCARAATTPTASPCGSCSQHTAGLFDYAASDEYDAINTSDPGHQWTRAEQLQFASRPR